MCPSLPDDVCEIIVKQFHGEYVLTVRRVSKTWNQFVSNVQMIKAFAGQSHALRFLFDRIWLKELFARGDGAFKLSVEQYSDLYAAVYYSTTFTKEGSREEKELIGEKNARSILKFAQDLNKELTMRCFDNKDLVRKALAHVFKYFDKFYLRRMGSSLARQLYIE
jgi:hypothetical protein